MKRIILSLLLASSISIGYSQIPEILFPAKKDGLWGFINAKGQWIIKPSYFNALEFTEGIAAVRNFGKWGYINAHGDWIIQPQYEQATPFSEELAAVVYQNRWGFIDHNGEFVIGPVYEKASSFSEGLAVVTRGDHYRFIDHTGKIITDGAYIRALPFTEGLALVNWHDNKGFINTSGQLVITHSFTHASPFSEGLAQVHEHGRWGFIDHSGNIVIPLQFSKTTQFSEGIASAMRSGKWGYLDKSGAWEIKSQFDVAYPFHLGFAVSGLKGRFGVIGPDGNWIIQPEFEMIGKAGRSISLKDEIGNRIRKAFSVWQMKKEFEKTDDYALRMTRENQVIAMDSIAALILKSYGNRLISLSSAELGYYDADRENFNIYIPGTMPTSLQVPIDEALWFKENWLNASITDTQFAIAGEKFVLTGYSVVIGSSVYGYDPREGRPATLTQATVTWTDEIEVPEIVWRVSNPDQTAVAEIHAAKPGTSDVDMDIPVTRVTNKNTFALIIGNEDYRSFQGGLNDEINVSFAAIDADIFSKYVHKTLGVPRKNITLLTNATAGQIKQALAKMSHIAKAYEGEAAFIFYYAGHGLPDEVSRKPYLIPVDVNGADLSFAISLDEALGKLTGNPHTRVTVFLDACFTGGGRNESLAMSRGVKIKPKSPFIKGNLIMFSASSGNESAFAFNEKAHGMFTYFLLKKLQESEGRVSYKELSDYLNKEVRRNSIIINNKAQTPEVTVSPSLEKSWEDFNLLVHYKPEVVRNDSR